MASIDTGTFDWLLNGNPYPYAIGGGEPALGGEDFWLNGTIVKVNDGKLFVPVYEDLACVIAGSTSVFATLGGIVGMMAYVDCFTFILADILAIPDELPPEPPEPPVIIDVPGSQLPPVPAVFPSSRGISNLSPSCQAVICCGDDEPIANYTADHVERPTFPSNAFFQDKYYIGYKCVNFGYTASCVSSVSQEDADQCALQLAQSLAWEGCRETPSPVPGPVPPPNDPIPPPPEPPVPVYYSSSKSCELPCATGGTYYHFTPGGYAMGLSQAIADAEALALCLANAAAKQMCIVGTPGACRNQTFNFEFQVTGPVTLASFAMISGALPPGLVLSAMFPAQNKLSLAGVPTAVGSYQFGLRVTDTDGNYTERVVSMVVTNCTYVSDIILKHPTNDLYFFLDYKSGKLIGLNIAGIEYNSVQVFDPMEVLYEDDPYNMQYATMGICLDGSGHAIVFLDIRKSGVSFYRVDVDNVTWELAPFSYGPLHSDYLFCKNEPSGNGTAYLNRTTIGRILADGAPNFVSCIQWRPQMEILDIMRIYINPWNYDFIIVMGKPYDSISNHLVLSKYMGTGNPDCSGWYDSVYYDTGTEARLWELNKNDVLPYYTGIWQYDTADSVVWSQNTSRYLVAVTIVTQGSTTKEYRLYYVRYDTLYSKYGLWLDAGYTVLPQRVVTMEERQSDGMIFMLCDDGQLIEFNPTTKAVVATHYTSFREILAYPRKTSNMVLNNAGTQAVVMAGAPAIVVL
jgi:hypothetical protein